jgi:hypothetical protein
MLNVSQGPASSENLAAGKHTPRGRAMIHMGFQVCLRGFDSDPVGGSSLIRQMASSIKLQ